MRRMLCLAILPIVAMAAANATMNVRDLQNWTYLDNGQSGVSTPAPWLSQRINGGTDLYGRLDTVGGTTYDWQFNGPSGRLTGYDPLNGTHVTWMYSTEPSGFSDRNMRYNFNNNSAWQYNIGPDFMQWGLNAFTNRAGYGTMDINPVTGCEYISSHLGQSDHQYPAVSRDLTPGAGVFETDSGPPNIVSFLWPYIAISQSERVHVGMIDYPARTALYYTNITWPDWLNPPVNCEPLPGFPTHNVAASKVSNKVCIAWQYDNSGSGGNLPYPAYYRISDDDGNTWGDPVELTYPPAFNPVPGESLGPSFHISSVYPFYDLHDNLHIAASVFCAANESMLYYVPVEIWHWSEMTGWTKVARAMEDSLPGDGSAYGFNTIYATRPTLSCDAAGHLVCVWEQFDCWNSEAATLRWRAEVWAAGSNDNGLTWIAPQRLTDPDETSKRYPTVAADFKADSIVVSYLVDLQAGHIVQAEGNATNNPWVVNTFHGGTLGLVFEDVVEGKPIAAPVKLALGVTPNPFRNGTSVSYALPKAGNVSLRVHDAAGRVVRTLVSGSRTPGHYTVTWDGTADNGSKLVPGVYFSTLTSGSSKLTSKLTRLQ